MRVVGEPIVIARTARGELAVFYNMCVHRGTEVAQGRGNTFGAKFAWSDDNVHLKPGGGLSIFIPFWLPGGGENHPDALVTQQSLWIDGARIAVDGVIVDPPPLAALAARLVPTVALPGASPSNV
jgi:Rieske 2Fe-2S protein